MIFARARRTSFAHFFFFSALVGIFFLLAGAASYAQSPTNATRLEVDETQAPQKILHVRMQMPVHPGPLVLSYPEWLPGEHQPNGPIINVAGLFFTANRETIPWRRDLTDMYAIHLEIPQGVSSLDVAFDFLLSAPESGYSSGASASAFLNVLNWNQVVLFPKGTDAGTLTFIPSLKMPAGWKFGTALPVAKRDPSESGGDKIDFAPVSLETLIDSPVLTGRYFRAINLNPVPTPANTPVQELDIAADDPADLAMPAETEAHYRKLVAEANALFGSHHYRDYHFLLTLSDHVAHFGLEHHESSDDRTREHFLIDEAQRMTGADLLPHEYVHSWNGKYRRPAGLLSPDYEQPMKDDLLWVYEGLTEYLGEVLTARSGLRTDQQERDYLAASAATLANEPGRRWRPLQDTADAAVFLYDAGTSWSNWRRGTDFYEEGVFVWLAVDDTIRRLTHDQKSLNDFCRLFYDGTSGQPDLKPYNLDDLVAALNQITPYDWKSFLRTRLDSLAPNTPVESLENSGWKLVLNDDPNEFQQKVEAVTRRLGLGNSIGLNLSDNGTLRDVIYNGPAYKAGFGPGMKITAVNGRDFSLDEMEAAIKDAETSKAPIQIIADNDSDVKTYSVDYHDGFRRAHLVRDNTHPDTLNEVLRPLTP